MQWLELSCLRERERERDKRKRYRERERERERERKLMRKSHFQTSASRGDCSGFVNKIKFTNL